MAVRATHDAVRLLRSGVLFTLILVTSSPCVHDTEAMKFEREPPSVHRRSSRLARPWYATAVLSASRGAVEMRPSLIKPEMMRPIVRGAVGVGIDLESSSARILQRRLS